MVVFFPKLLILSGSFGIMSLEKIDLARKICEKIWLSRINIQNLFFYRKKSSKEISLTGKNFLRNLFDRKKILEKACLTEKTF
jgi:hypothetical protein